jgi:hypothetical protein
MRISSERRRWRRARPTATLDDIAANILGPNCEGEHLSFSGAYAVTPGLTVTSP